MNNEVFKVNNLNLIRVLASLQVVLFHTQSSLKASSSLTFLMELLSYFPGVPIFFFVSGFLISKSYEKNNNLYEYFINRSLRLFPALVVCTILSIVAVYFTGYFSHNTFGLFEFFFWIFGQVTFFQFYNPDFMRGFGVGVLNGSLWTISVELQFYIIVPILYFFLKNKTQKVVNQILFVITLTFLTFFYAKFNLFIEHKEHILYKLFSVSFLPWIWMFFSGIFVQKNFDWFYRKLAGKFIYMFMIYVLVAFISRSYMGLNIGNNIHPFLFALLVIVIFSASYTAPRLSYKILKSNDISYGAYIYHMPVVNVFLYFKMGESYKYVLFVIIITITLSILSWKLVEKKAIKLKKRPLKPILD